MRFFGGFTGVFFLPILLIFSLSDSSIVLTSVGSEPWVRTTVLTNVRYQTEHPHEGTVSSTPEQSKRALSLPADGRSSGHSPLKHCLVW